MHVKEDMQWKDSLCTVGGPGDGNVHLNSTFCRKRGGCIFLDIRISSSSCLDTITSCPSVRCCWCDRLEILETITAHGRRAASSRQVTNARSQRCIDLAASDSLSWLHHDLNQGNDQHQHFSSLLMYASKLKLLLRLYLNELLPE